MSRETEASRELGTRQTAVLVDRSTHITTAHMLIVVSVVSFAATYAELPRATWTTLSALSLAAGVTAISFMGAAALLGGRFKTVESLFGGLDRLYLTHKWLGIAALVFASLHFALPADHDAWQTAAILELPRFPTRLLRQLSFLALMLIVLLALDRKIPYSVWRWWHKLSGPFFVVVILHWLTIRSPIALASVAGFWLAIVAMLGVAGAAYKLLLYPFASNHGRYRVVVVSPGAAAVHLELVPVTRPVEFKAGQFGFLRMKEEGLREPHPFTIAGADAGRVHFVIRALGDYTQRLVAQTTVGMQAEIYGPYGRFARPAVADREIWIGGGVGISPFIAWLADEAAGGFDKVTLFYFFTPGREFPSAEVMQRFALERGAAFVAVPDGPLSSDFVQRFSEIAANVDPHGIAVTVCGPKGLLERIRGLARDAGIPAGNLRHEHFEFR